MTTMSPEVPVEAASTRPRLPLWVGRLGTLAALAAAFGGIASVVWAGMVRLPAYTVLADGTASVTERALTEFFAADAWFTAIGSLVGLALGIAAWRWFKPLGWVAPIIAGSAGLVAGLVCWQVGQLLGPGDFDERLAAAAPGDQVPIALTLHAPSALAVWAFAAVTPVLLASSLGPDETLPRAVGRRRRRHELRTDENELIDDRGVVTAEDTKPGGSNP